MKFPTRNTFQRSLFGKNCELELLMFKSIVWLGADICNSHAAKDNCPVLLQDVLEDGPHQNVDAQLSMVKC